MVVGEPQILGQMKTAYSAARDAGALHGFLELVLTRAFSVAKRVRSETEIGKSAVSVSYAAVELAREIFSSLNERKVMLVGAGKMSELAARHLKRAGCSQVYLTNRTPERAAAMADLFGGEIVDYARFKERLPEMDIVVTSSGAPHYLLSRDDMRRVFEARRNRPVFVIDIAVPRNVDPSVDELEHVYLYDIDDLQQRGSQTTCAGVSARRSRPRRSSVRRWTALWSACSPDRRCRPSWGSDSNWSSCGWRRLSACAGGSENYAAAGTGAGGADTGTDE